MKKLMVLKLFLSIFALTMVFQVEAISKTYQVGDCQVNIPDDWQYTPDTQGFSMFKKWNEAQVMGLQTHWGSFSRNKNLFNVINASKSTKETEKFQTSFYQDYENLLDKIKIGKIEKKEINGLKWIFVKWSGSVKDDFYVPGLKGKKLFFTSFFSSEKFKKFPFSVYKDYSVHAFTTMESHRTDRQLMEIMNSWKKN